MTTGKYQIGDTVLATPKDNDFGYEFEGIIIQYDGLYYVRDQNDDVFMVDEDQLSFV